MTMRNFMVLALGLAAFLPASAQSTYIQRGRGPVVSITPAAAPAPRPDPQVLQALAARQFQPFICRDCDGPTSSSSGPYDGWPGPWTAPALLTRPLDTGRYFTTLGYAGGYPAWTLSARYPDPYCVRPVASAPSGPRAPGPAASPIR
jgi:hypothetical protein